MCTRQFLDDPETKLCEKECEILLQKNLWSVVFCSMTNFISEDYIVRHTRLCSSCYGLSLTITLGTVTAFILR